MPPELQNAAYRQVMAGGPRRVPPVTHIKWALRRYPPSRREKGFSSLRGANGSGPNGRPDDRLRDEAIQNIRVRLDRFAFASLGLAMTSSA